MIWPPHRPWLVALLLTACTGTEAEPEATCLDQDGDGVAAGDACMEATDCDDSDPEAWLSAIAHPDLDRDTVGAGDPVALCVGDELPDGFAFSGTDCNDADATVWQLLDAFVDLDGDGFGVGEAMSTCSPDALLPGWSAEPRDCDDSSATTHPGAAELEVNPTRCMRDADDDGWGDERAEAPVQAGGDCDDGEPRIGPGATELDDGVDDDCDGDSLESDRFDSDDDGYTAGFGAVGDPRPDCDDGDPFTSPGAAFAELSAAGCSTDADGDGWGDPLATAPAVGGTDCDDTDPATHPGAAPEEGIVDGCLRDADGDGWGDSATDGVFVPGTDCDDGALSVYPGATERDDGVDEDCDGDALELDPFDGDGDGFTADHGTLEIPLADCNDSDATIYPGVAYAEDDPLLCAVDADGDGWGSRNPAPPVFAGSDCNDADPSISPGQPEADDGLDENCDGNRIEIDLFDLDGDGFTPGFGNQLVQTPDCDDTDPDTFPGAAQLEPDPTPCRRDRDDDGWGDQHAVAPITPGADCNDDTPAAIPFGTEVDDGIDNDCDGDVFELDLYDADGDGFTPGAGGPELGIADCDDTDPFTHPGAAADDDPEACMTDADEDGWGDEDALPPAEPGHDCDDTEPSLNPGAPELDDGEDQDCDGDRWEASQFDTDGDGFTPGWGNILIQLPDCDDSDPFAYPGAAVYDTPGACMRDVDGDRFGDADAVDPVLPGTDCDDELAEVNPDMSETPGNGLDDDCDPLTTD